MHLPCLTRRESCLLSLFAFLLALAIMGPSVQSPDSALAAFVDTRAWHGMPDVMDVLSNLPLAIIGLWGLRWLHWLDRAHEELQDSLPAPLSIAPSPINTLDCAWMFFAGLFVTAAGSGFYHLQPDELRLTAERASVTVAFAGLIGLVVCERVSARAGWSAAWFSLGGGLLAVAVQHETGNVLPWGLVQFGGMALVLALAVLKPADGAIGIRLGWVIFFCALAKLFELSDNAIHEATHHLISGHSLKHVTAALTALPLMQALEAMGRRTLRHNPGAAALTA